LRHAACSIALLLAALSASLAARASEVERATAGGPALEPGLPQRRVAHLGVEAALTTSPNGPTVDSLGGAMRVAGDYRFASGLGVSVEGGVSTVSLEIEGQSPRAGTFFGNALLGVSFERSLRPGLDAAASLRVGAPLALYPGGIDDNRLAELAYGMAASAQGFREPFIWQANVAPLVLGVRAGLRANEWLMLSGQIAPAYLISVNQRPSRLAVASQVDAAAVFQPLVAHVGLSHFVSTLPLENRERDQLAVRLGAGVLLHGQRYMLDLSIGLDDPYGAFQSDPHPWWGIGIVADVEFGADTPTSKPASSGN
jgi:hypothetical protein